MTALTFAAEPLTRELLDEALPLLREHWAEVAHYADIPLDVDVDTYLATAVAGNVRCFTARHYPCYQPTGPQVSSGLLLGYAVFFARRNLHYKYSLQAVQDVLYLHPSARGGTGAKFIAWCDAQLAAEGVQVVYQHQKMAHPQLGNALAALGYEPVERMWSKRLDRTQSYEWARGAGLSTVSSHGAPANHEPVMGPRGCIICLAAEAAAMPSVELSRELMRRVHREFSNPAPWNADDATNDANRTHLLDFSETMQQLAGAHE